MPRLSITLTDKQAEALERIAAETGATKQSMISLAITDWLVQYIDKQIAVEPTATETPQKTTGAAEKPAGDGNGQVHAHTSLKPSKPLPQRHFTILRDGVPVAWLKGHWETASHCTIIVEAHKLSEHGEWHDMPADERGRKWTHDVAPNEEVIEY